MPAPKWSPRAHKFHAVRIWACSKCGNETEARGKKPEQRHCGRCGARASVRCFPSKRELNRYRILIDMERRGEIRNLEPHPRYPIVIEGVKICVVELDSAYFRDNERVVEDVKGMDNPLSALKRKLVEAVYRMKVTVVK